MDGWIETFIASVTAFAATNIDDIFVLMLFFSARSPSFRTTHIVIGQYIGFTALIAISVVGVLGGLLIPTAWIGMLGFLPIFIAIKRVVSRRKDETHLPLVATSKSGWLGNFIAAQTLSVAGVTVANGGDNVGVYVPFFANYHAVHLAAVAAIFFVMVGVWCFIGYKLSKHRVIASVIDRFGHRLVPVGLAGIGIYIIYKSGAWALLTGGD